MLLPVLLLCGLASVVLLYRHFTVAERIRAIAQAHLQRYTNGLVSVGGAKTSWLGGVRLFDVAVAEVGSETHDDSGTTAASRTRPVFSCREVRLTHDFASAVFGDLRIRSVVALQPTCSIVCNPADGRTNLAGLMRFPTPESTEPSDLPTIELRDARIQVASQEVNRMRVVDDLTLTIRARPSQRDPAVCDVVWQGTGERPASGHSQIDLTTGRVRNIQGGLPRVSLETMMLALNAKCDASGAWGESLGLEGTVRATDYDLSADGARSAVVELSNASISIPISEEERRLPLDNRYVRFEGMNGDVRMTEEAITARLAGTFHGGRCNVEATIRGGLGELVTLDDLDFDARVSVDGLILPLLDPEGPPAEVRFINRWPLLAEFYANYDPHVPADVEVEVTKRAGRDDPVVVRRAKLTAKGGEVLCRRLPYRLHNLTGAVECAPEGIYVRDIRGEHGGGVVSIDGRTAGPMQPGGGELAVKGTAIPIDDALWDALPARYHKLREQFDPDGTVDFELSLTKPAGETQQTSPWHWNATVTLAGLSADYTGFPYPLTDLRGTVVLDEQSVRVMDVVGRAREARVSVDGTVTFARDGLEDLDLAIRAEDVDLDNQFLSALPGTVQSRIQSFHPQGRFNLRTSLKLDPATKRIAHGSTITLSDCSIRPDKLPVEISGILGRVHVTPDRAVFEGLTGLYNGAVISAEGTVNLTAARPAVQFTVRTRNLQFDDRLLAALPERIGTTLSGWRFDGPVETETLLTTDPEAEGYSVVAQTLVQVSGAAVGHPLFPMPFRDVRGQISIDAAAIRAEDIEARYGDADIRANVQARFEEHKERGVITLTAANLTLDDSIRGCLRSRLAAAWDRLNPSGSIDLRLDALRYERSDPHGPREWSADGHVELKDVALAGLANLQGMSGTLTGRGFVVDRAGGMSLYGDLNLSTLTMLGLRLSHTSAAWSCARAADGEGLLALDSVHGRIYDGDLAGDLKLMFDVDRADYELSAKVRRMQIGPFLHATRATRHVDGEAVGMDDQPAGVQGLADGHLYLSGPLGDPTSRRGGGRFEFLEARIQRLPIILAILTVLNLSIPDQDAFENVRAEFLVVGNHVHVNDIELRGSGLALSGSGSVSLPDWGVDLNLINVTPHRWARIPVLADLVEGAAGELVELHVTGPLFQPTVRAVPFRAVREELNQLFKKRKPKPLPPTRP
jgi:hypothetical protein